MFVSFLPSLLSAQSTKMARFAPEICEKGLQKKRNDEIEDKYSVLIELVNQSAVDTFYFSLNGKRFSPAEAELCHILFMHSDEYTELSEIASTPPEGFAALPTCPICLDTSGILGTFCDHSFPCRSCTSKWTYMSCTVCQFCQQQDENPVCSVCGSGENLWICLICGFMGCRRYKEGHAVRHWKDTQHRYSLELISQQIWDYVGDGHVHRLDHSRVDGKLVEMNSRCTSIEGTCRSCGCADDSGINEVIYSSKVGAVYTMVNYGYLNLADRKARYIVFDEFSRLLATELEKQRQNYESMLAEAKSKREYDCRSRGEGCDIGNEGHPEEASESRLMDEKILDLEEQIRDLKVYIEAQKTLDMTDSDGIRGEREASESRLMDEKILDLEEQIRDLKVYIEAQKTLDMTDSDGIRGGTVLPVPPTQSSSANRGTEIESKTELGKCTSCFCIVNRFSKSS
ncbi:topless-related protein 4-like [Hibiscus syriacus]|uniref:Topless-related protein 4-like n=1 Tax=Hibiscus syriacus TaxID=106335 RepID=A0A6A3AFF6_HIBSY|nr:topless-related protein 4-like [Hibiscus syriacus]